MNEAQKRALNDEELAALEAVEEWENNATDDEKAYLSELEETKSGKD